MYAIRSYYENSRIFTQWVFEEESAAAVDQTVTDKEDGNDHGIALACEAENT